MSSKNLNYFTINAYDFDVAYSKPNENGEVKGAKVQIPYVGTVIIPAKNVYIPEQETKTFGGKGSFKGHKEYKNCVITIRTGEKSDGSKYSYPVLTKTKNGKTNRFNMTGDELQAKIEKFSQGFIDKTGKKIKHNYSMVIKEYDPESKTVVKSRNLWKESQENIDKTAKEEIEVLSEIQQEDDAEWMKDLEELQEELESSIDENKSLTQAQ